MYCMSNVTFSKLPPTVRNIPNEDIIYWLEKHHPVLADTYASDFNGSINRPIRTTVTKTSMQTPATTNHCSIASTEEETTRKQTGSTIPTANGHSMNNNNAASRRYVVNNVLRHYHTLSEEGQKDVWLGALASNDADLIQELTILRTNHARLNLNTQLAKLTKDLLTHSEKHKIDELKYEEKAGKRRLLFSQLAYPYSPCDKDVPSDSYGTG